MAQHVWMHLEADLRRDAGALDQLGQAGDGEWCASSDTKMKADLASRFRARSARISSLSSGCVRQPGFSLTSIYSYGGASAGADVARAREITTGRIPVNLNVNLSANLDREPI